MGYFDYLQLMTLDPYADERILMAIFGVSNYEYISFIIFIEVLSLHDSLISPFLIRDLFLHLNGFFYIILSANEVGALVQAEMNFISYLSILFIYVIIFRLK